MIVQIGRLGRLCSDVGVWSPVRIQCWAPLDPDMFVSGCSFKSRNLFTTLSLLQFSQLVRFCQPLLYHTAVCYEASRAKTHNRIVY